jgi:hypothetical protein
VSGSCIEIAHSFIAATDLRQLPQYLERVDRLGRNDVPEALQYYRAEPAETAVALY